MKLSNIIEGLQILSKYFKDADGYHTGADHDVFYVYATDLPVQSDHVNRLVELGWFQPEADTGDDDEFEPKHYDPEETWHAYT